jgi:uncharacterized protein with HEPN domain
MPKDDRIRLRHMLDAAREAAALAKGRTRSDLDTDRALALALVKCLEMLGEAAARTSPAGRALAPGLPWPEIVGMRNRLIHAYFEIDYDRVWDTVETDLPPLLQALETALGPLP